MGARIVGDNGLEALLDQAKLQLKFYYRFIWDLQTERHQVSQFWYGQRVLSIC